MLSLSFSHYAAVPSCFAAHWRTRIGLAVTTAFDNDSGARWQILGIFYPVPSVNKDPFPVSPSDVTIILRELRGAFVLLPGRWLGSPLLRYFKSGLTRRNLPPDLGRSVGYEKLCSHKVRRFCSGLERCAYTEAQRHSLQRCKTLSRKRSAGLQNPKP